MHFYMFFMIVKKVPHFLLIISEAINIYIFVCIYIHTHAYILLNCIALYGSPFDYLR